MELHGLHEYPIQMKKFMCQKETLDFLRVYIDVTDEFVTSLHQQVLLNDHEHLLIQKLRWPSNRNELLQALVKRQWTEAQFRALLQVLEETQSAQLASAFDTRAQQFVEGTAG